MTDNNDEPRRGGDTCRGSRRRCLQLTQGPNASVAQILTEIVHPVATVDCDGKWMPRGFLQPREARLGEDPAFLSLDCRTSLTNWWLAERRGANTPNWDIASTCTIGKCRGVLLVEAKAHDRELSKAGKSAPDEKSNGSVANDRRIREAIAEANKGLGTGWRLSADCHYQLSNRFAWAWKLAKLGIPVVLVYLGFLNAHEMADRGRPFGSACDWEDAVRDHARPIVPDTVWNQRLMVDGMQAPIYPLIRAMDQRWEVARPDDLRPSPGSVDTAARPM